MIPPRRSTRRKLCFENPLMIIIMEFLLLLSFYVFTVDASENLLESDGHGGEGEGEGEEDAPYAVLFPSFTLTLGIIIYFLLSRYAKVLPYTGVMFLMGTLIGIIVHFTPYAGGISKTVRIWANINGEVLLLVFLPGLIFKDAYSQNTHLFIFALGQLLNFAFPMVLAGTTLTALVGFYIFPFGWSFNLAMTFGSILSATDPVAVAALLEEVGAPPRLKVHVAGESLLNDGSAIVFFSIFKDKFLYELGIPGVGQDIGWPEGIGLFCKKALGGAAIGLAFGLGLLGVLYVLNRRFSREENVVQVTAVITIAYLNFYVGDFATKTSGVIATVVAGLVVKLVGRAMVNDQHLLEDFLSVVEHILNTILFSLGGVIWGATIVEGEMGGSWTGTEWAYLMLLYVLLHVIRLISFVAAYPITVRIGLKTNWKETIFQVYGGLRGAVGIALAIVLDSEVLHHEAVAKEEKEDTEQVFGMVGGIAFMTLAINGVTAGPILRKLGLADSTEIRQKITNAYEVRVRAAAIDDMVRLLTYQRFHRVNFEMVKQHVPYLADLTKQQLVEAVQKHKESTPKDDYIPPFLGGIWPYLQDDPFVTDSIENDELEALLYEDEYAKQLRLAERGKKLKKARTRRRISSNLRFMLGSECDMSTLELRLLFLSILRSVYERQEVSGELEGYHILSVSLEQSLDFSEDAVSNGEPLKDWEFLKKIHEPIANLSRAMIRDRAMICCNWKLFKHRSVAGLQVSRDKMFIERSLAFMAGHIDAQKLFLQELQDVDSQISESAKLVIQESKEQFDMAAEALQAFDRQLVELTESNKFCKILLNFGIAYMERLVHAGLLKESEAEPYIEELEEYLHHTVGTNELHHSHSFRNKPTSDPDDTSAHDYLTSDRPAFEVVDQEEAVNGATGSNAGTSESNGPSNESQPPPESSAPSPSQNTEQ